MSQLPENRKPLLWKDMPFSERPKAHPSTERLEIEKLQERVAELEARIAKVREEALREAADVAIGYGEQQYSANVVHHPQYADDAQEDGQEIARLILALTQTINPGS